MMKKWLVENRWRFAKDHDPNILDIGDWDTSDNPK